MGEPAVPDTQEVADYYRERKMLAVVFTVDSEPQPASRACPTRTSRRAATALRSAPRLRFAPGPRRMSIPELAEQMGHSPQQTVSTYAHVIRELKGEPAVPAEEQIARAREDNEARQAG